MKNIEDIYELSHMQLGILLDTISMPGSAGYHQQLSFILHGNINETAFRQAWQKLIDTHEVFRTSFHWEDIEKPIQAVHREMELNWIRNDYSNLAPELARKEAKSLLELDKEQLFVLDRPGLIRCYLAKIAKDEYRFIVSYHHLLIDGWCIPLILQDALKYYSVCCTGGHAGIFKRPRYRNYIQWLQRCNTGEAKEFWEKELRGFYEANKLCNIPVSPLSIAYAPKEIECVLSSEVSEGLTALAKQWQITPYTIFQGFWALAISRFTLDTDIVFGTTVAGRPQEIAEVNNMVGLFINTIPVRIGVNNEIPVRNWLTDIFEKYRSNEKYSYASLSDIKKWSSTAHNQPLFETVLVYENYPLNNFSAGQADLQMSEFELIERPNVPLALIVIPGREFRLKLIYNEQLLNAWFVRSLLQSIECALLYFIQRPASSAADLNWVTKPDECRLLPGFTGNNIIKEPADVWSRFLLQVNKTPDKIIIKEYTKEYTYAQLRHWCGHIADTCKKTGLVKGDRVGIFMENSAEMIAVILAILKSGCTYVPIDPEAPAARIAAIINDSNVRLVVCNGLLANRFTALNLSINTMVVESYQEHTAGIELANSEAQQEDVAYIIYTSGSTGVPKGVQITHRNLLNYVDWAADYYVEGESAFAFYSSLAFDLTVTSLYVPLFTGNTIVVYRGDDKALIVQEIIADNRVNIIKLTPSHLKIVRSVGSIRSSIKKMIVGGENLERTLADDVIRNFSNDLVLYNEYGPTEATVGCFIFRYKGEGVNGHSIPIGYPVRNMTGYVLDENLKPVPAGAKGELCVTGLGVSPGYFHNEDLNAERFKKNPYEEGAVLYRTGDIVRQNEDGNLEFLGRADDQIKVRGHRVEMGEIEVALNRYPGIESAAVALIAPKRKTWDIEDIHYCNACGIQSNYPNITFNNNGVCSICQSFEVNKVYAEKYFRPMDDLKKIFEQNRNNNESNYDCLMLLSGGKDSTYALCKLVRDLHLRVLVFTMDNGFISEYAKQNMQRVCAELNVELIFGSTEAMNAIFKDSLQKHSNVCQGCYKTIYTLSIQLAKEKNIPYIVTGLSRGQLFETRLNELYNAGIFEPDEIDAWVLAARKEYHRKQDVISANFDISYFKSDDLFEKIRFVDFYRFCDVTLEEMYAYLNHEIKWVKPADTGRSTNCFINDLGIYVHKKERGYHSYALPYSWDVRLGHKKRAEALKELDDEPDPGKIKKMMDAVGYSVEAPAKPEEQLFAFYTSQNDIPGHELKAWLKKHIPGAVIPSACIRLNALPLTVNGKIDRKALRYEGNAAFFSRAEYEPPHNLLEKEIIEVWKEVLGLEDIGIRDNIFDIGGHSMTMTLIFNKLKIKINLSLSLVEMYEHPTVGALAEKITSISAEPGYSNQEYSENKQRKDRNAHAAIRKKARADIETIDKNQ